MKKVIVLGAGMVGSAIAADLSTYCQVTSVDINSDNFDFLLAHNVQTIISDLSDTNNIKQLVAPFDLVVGAVPGFMGFQTVKAVIEANKNIVDISFFPEDAFLLDDLAKNHNVTAIVDCGVAPGMHNVILGYHAKRMKVTNFETLVGGLPLKRDFPFEYKAPFSPVDVVEEYTRPSRYVENSCLVTKPALSDPELIDFDEIGTLESFNTDGLRSLIYTMPDIPNMKEKTLRYPGHIRLIQALKVAGFFDENKINISGAEISPFDFTTKILFKSWKLGKQDEEFTVMRVVVQGIENDKPVKYTYNLLDRNNKVTGVSSMARTTGYACTSAVNLLINGKFDRIGICPPEYLGENEICFNAMLTYQFERDVIYRCIAE
jgi:saccharopine dehydrogenase-like NADP-dependent oxidoreductase